MLNKLAMDSAFRLRAAAATDIETLIDLMMVSSWGGIEAAWERARGPDETWRERGAAEIADIACGIGYSRFVLAEEDGRPAGMILLNILGDTDMIDPEREPPAQAGALFLIKQADHSVFVREIAVADWARGRGLATQLLAFADDIAEARATARVTLIVNDFNEAAHRLYRKLGFRPISQVPSIGHPAFPDSSALVLMEKPVQSSR